MYFMHPCKVGQKIEDISYNDRDTIFYLRGPWANRRTSKASNFEIGSGGTPLEKFEASSSDWLKIALIFVP